MNGKNLKRQVIHHLAEIDVPGDKDAWQIMKKRLAKNESANRGRPHLRGITLRLVTALGSAVVIILVIFAIAPARHALAEALRWLFNATDAQEIPIENSLRVATPTFAPTFSITLSPVAAGSLQRTPALVPTDIDPISKSACADDPYGYTCKIAWAEKKAGFDAREFPAVPDHLKFDDVYVNRNNEIIIQYSLIGGGGYLYFFQGMDNEPQSTTSEVYSGAIEKVMVGNYPGEFVAGMFVTTGDPPVYSWSPAGRARLLWTEGERWFELDSEACMKTYFCPGRDELIQMASQLVDKPLPENGLNEGYLENLDEVDQLADFDILVPTILPQKFEFSYASYDSDLYQVEINFCPTDMQDQGAARIMIVETPIEKVFLNPTENEKEITGENVEINGQSGIYVSNSGFYHILTWQHEKLRITLSVYSSDLWYGGIFTKEQVLEIARSMQ